MELLTLFHLTCGVDCCPINVSYFLCVQMFPPMHQPPTSSHIWPATDNLSPLTLLGRLIPQIMFPHKKEIKKVLPMESLGYLF